MPRGWRRRVFTALSLCLWIAAGSAPVWGQEPLHWRFYTSRDGLFESWISAVTVNPSGKVWITHGNVNEITVFDGYRFRRFRSPGGDIKVHESRSGRIWALWTESNGLTVRGLQELQGDRWVGYAIDELKATDLGTQEQFLAADGNRVLFLLPDRLYAFDAQTRQVALLKRAGDAHLGPFSSLAEAADGGVWVVGERGYAKLPRIDDATATPTLWRETLLPETLTAQKPQRFFEAPNGDLYGAAKTLADGKAVALRHAKGAWSILAVAESPQDRVWAWPGVDNRLWIIRQLSNSFTIVQDPAPPETMKKTKVLSGRLNDFAVGRDGSFWLATSLGLAHYAPAIWRTPPAVAHLQSHVGVIREDRQGRIYFLYEKNLVVAQDDAWVILPLPAGVEANVFYTEALAALPDGRIAMTPSGEGVTVFDPRSQRFEVVKYPKGRVVELVGQRKDGSAWIVAWKNNVEFSLDVYDGRTFREFYDAGTGWHIGGPRRILERDNGEIWIGSGEGNRLGLIKNGTYRSLGPEDGYTCKGVFSMLDVGGGKIWFGNRNDIRQLDDKNWTTIRTNLETVRSMTRTRDGTIWVASGAGLHRYKDGSWSTFTAEDGLPDGAVFAIHEDSRGRIWVGTTQGLSLYHPEADRDPPETVIDETANLRQTPPGGEVRFLISGFDAWNHDLPDQLSFSHRIDGDAWSPFQPRTIVSVKGIAPGPHRFEARAMDRNWNIDPTPAVFAFTVLLPWYREPMVLWISVIGGLAVVLLIGQHLSHYRRLERLVAERTREIAGANEQLEQRVAERTAELEAFMHSVTHDLRAPLRNIEGFGQVLLDDCAGQLDAKGQNYLRRMNAATLRMGRLIDDLLALSRVMGSEINRSHVDLSELAQTVADELRRTRPERQVEFVIAPRLVARVDAGLLRTALENLLGNAWKFTGREPQARIEFGVTERDGRRTYFVRDNGVGFDMAEADRLFQVFERLHRTEEFEGTGIGLTTVQRIVRKHGGKVWAEAAPEQGATFYFTLEE